MPNSIFYKISRFYAHHNIAPLKDINNFFADSFLGQGIAVGQTSHYKIYFCYNKRLANQIKNLWFGCASDFVDKNVLDLLRFVWQ